MAIISTFPGGSGGETFKLGDVQGVSITSTMKAVSIAWTDPSNVEISGTVVAQWEGTRVVRKAGSAPSDRYDGDVVVDSKEKNQYASTPFVDTVPNYDTTYYYRFFPYTTGNTYTEGSSVSVTPERVIINTVPSQSGTLSYTGETLTPLWSNYDSSKVAIGGTYTGINAGTYTATFTPLADYMWSDRTTTAIEVGWSIDKMSLATPVFNGGLVWDGTQKTATFTGYDSNYMSVSGNTGTLTGNYTATFSLLDSNNTEWADSETATIDVEWNIEKMSISVPTVDIGTYVYDGDSQGPSVTRDTTNTTLTGNTTGTNAGDYSFTITLNDTNVMKWSDDSTAAKVYNFTIQKASLVVPTVTNTSLTYTGSAIGPTITGFNSTLMTKSGDTATNAGSYVLVFGLADSDNYQWSGNNIVNWSIAKASGSIAVSSASVTLTANDPTATVTLTVVGDGQITTSSSDTSVATASISGTTLTISGVNNNNGSATITVTLAEGTNYLGDSDTVSVTAEFVRIYGAEWDESSSPVWSRTDDAANFVDPTPAVNNGTGSSPFDNIMPWSGMQIVEDATAGTLVSIPKYYYKWTGMKLQISMTQEEGFLTSPAHADRGDGVGERDVVYVGRYHCASDYKSKTGVKPLASITRATARTNIHNLGSQYYQYDFAMMWTIWMLYLVEFADWNSQAVIGYGRGNGSSTENMGATDAMQYHTGTAAASRTTYAVGVQYRYIEDLWANVFDWTDGVYFGGTSKKTVYVIKNPNSFSDSSGGTSVGTRPTSSGCTTGWNKPTTSGLEWARYPSTVNGEDYSVYVCDQCYYYSSGVVLYSGGDYYRSQLGGLFYLCGYSSASGSSASVGSRLQKLPAA